MFQARTLQSIRNGGALPCTLNESQKEQGGEPHALSYIPLTIRELICDNQWWPVWYTTLPKIFRNVPEVKDAIYYFETRQWKPCSSAIERALEIAQNLPQAKKLAEISLQRGKLLTALHEQLHLREPEKWKRLVSVACEYVLAFCSSDNADSTFDFTPLFHAFIAVASLTNCTKVLPALFCRLKEINPTSESLPLSQYQIFLSPGSDSLPIPPEFNLLLQKLTTQTEKKARLSEVGDKPTQGLSAIEAPDVLCIKICTAALKELKLLKDNLFSAYESEEPLHTNSVSSSSKISLEDLHKWVEALPRGNVDSDLPGFGGNLTPHTYITIALSIPNCPLKVLQYALKLSKCSTPITHSRGAFTHSYPQDTHSRYLLTAMCLRALAMRYRSDYVYCSGLFRSALSAINSWTEAVPGLSMEERTAVTNRLIRNDFVTQLRHLGQVKEAESIGRRYGIVH